METSNSKMLEKILKTAEEIKNKTGNRYLSKEIVLLAYFVRIEQSAAKAEADEELSEVITIVENSFTDTQAAVSALKNQIGEVKATAENSQDWYNAFHNMQAISHQIRAVRFDAGILLKVLLADPPVCVRPFLSAEEDAADIKADSMFARTPEELSHAPEFLDFLNEVRGVAPLLKQTESEFTLTNQAILISTEDDEYAILTYLHMINDLYNETGLVEFSNPPGIVPISSEVLMNGAFPAISQFTLDKIGGMVLCLDISEWVGGMDEPEFTEFLMKCCRRQGDFVFVFRVPYIEKTVLRSVAEHIQDLFSLRVISFEPWSLDYMADLAVSYIQEAGFEPDEKAMEVFRLRITEERSDGHFYGYATIRKVADEMIYLKQKSLIESGRVTLTIDGNAVQKLSQSRLADLDSAYLMSKLTGKEKIKKQLKEIFAGIKADPSGYKHMYFIGDPGTGKTLSAKIVAKYLKENGILEKGRYFEYRLDDFIGFCDGATMPKAMSLLRDAYGSVIVINSPKEYGNNKSSEKECRADRADDVISYEELVDDALSTIITQMRVHAEDLIVVFAGTQKEIDGLEDMHPDLKELVPYKAEFERFTDAELTEIFMKLIPENGYVPGTGLKEAVREYFDKLYAEMASDKEFTSARFVNNLFDSTMSKAAVRCEMDGSDPTVLTSCDFILAAKVGKNSLNRKKKDSHVIGFDS